MTKIDKVSDLPKWFDLNKYESVSDFTATDWIIQLTLRSFAINMMRTMQHSSNTNNESIETAKNSEHDEKYIIGFFDLIKALRDTPTSSNLNGNFYWDYAVSSVTPEHLHLSQPVRSLTLKDIIIKRNSYELDFEDGITTEQETIIWKYLNKDIKIEDFEDEEDSHGYFETIPEIEISLEKCITEKWDKPSIVVDLNAPDSLLVNSFKYWLSSQRASPPAEAITPRKPAFSWWGKYGLLPYIDLLVWSDETGIHIPDRVMAEAISKFTSGEDRLRKTLKPIAADLNKLIEGLSELAATERVSSSNPEFLAAQ